MRIVIIGASGNVGTALLRRLTRDDSDHDVTGVVRRPPNRVGVYRTVRWHALDIAEPTAGDELCRIFENSDAVVNLAWGFQPTRNTGYLTRVGVGGTAAVLHAAHTAGVSHLVHMSSVGTYAAGRYGQRVDESWSTAGISTSAYSRDKSAAELLLDDYETRCTAGTLTITRMRPGFIVQRRAASGLMRYGLPAWLPMAVVPRIPILPMDRRLCIPIVHADDVADAFAAALERRAAGPFNLAADPPIGRDDVASVFGALPAQFPAAALGALVSLSWQVRLQPVDRGWLDMAFSVPLLDCRRAQDVLGWTPSWSSISALADVIRGVRDHAHGCSPPLRSRTVRDSLRRNITEGLIETRHLP